MTQNVKVSARGDMAHVMSWLRQRRGLRYSIGRGHSCFWFVATHLQVRKQWTGLKGRCVLGLFVPCLSSGVCFACKLSVWSSWQCSANRFETSAGRGWCFAVSRVGRFVHLQAIRSHSALVNSCHRLISFGRKVWGTAVRT